MKTWLRAFIFVMAFQLEVRVKASDVVLENPEHCLASAEVCALKVRETAFHFKKENTQFHATKDSMLERKSANNWSFIRGQVWVERSKGIVFETIHGSAKATQGEYWLTSAKDKIFLRNISSDIEVTLRDGKVVQVPAGFQFWIGGLNSEAKSEYGMIEPVDMKELLPVWNKLFAGKKSDFTAKIKNLRESWGNLVEVSSEIYREQTLRKIASVEEQKNNEATKVFKAKQEKQRLREAYRARVFDR